MTEEEKAELEDGEPSGWSVFGKVVVGLLAAFGALVVISVSWAAITDRHPPQSKMEQSLESYKRAVDLCGEKNIDTHEYNDGSKDFDCYDYSEAKK